MGGSGAIAAKGGASALSSSWNFIALNIGVTPASLHAA
jgi:hypothetical protein